MEIVTKRLDELRPDPRNPRSHGEENMAAIIASLQRFGQCEPLVLQRGTGRIVAGHGRLEGMRRLGWETCQVVELDIDDATASALGIALNRSGELAGWNQETLATLLSELRDDFGLEGIGFSESGVDQLLADLALNEPREVEDPGEQEPPENPVTRLGDLWILGDHKLLCGDSTKAEDMQRLMGRDVAMLCASDPPYLVDYDGTNHPAEHHAKAGREASEGKLLGNKHWDAYVDPKTSVQFFADYLRIALAHCDERAPVYQWHATRRQALVEQAWEMNGLLLHQTVVWCKSRGVLTRSHFLWKHEPAFYGWRKGMQPERDRRPPPSETTIWEIDQAGEDAKGLHPTMKPVAIFERPISWHTRPGEVVLEPFSGSGTQIIAAEKLARRCRAMELSPPFVDAAVQRWQKATGKQAVLDGDGRSFDEIAAERVQEPAS